MNEKLSDKHERDWEVFDVLSNMALDDLIEEHLSTHKQYGMVRDHVPEDKRNELQRSRMAWMEEWGPRGREVKALADRHQHERESVEMDHRYQKYLAEEQEKTDTTAQDFKEQLKTIRERNHKNTQRPKPG